MTTDEITNATEDELRFALDAATENAEHWRKQGNALMDWQAMDEREAIEAELVDRMERAARSLAADPFDTLDGGCLL